MSCRDSSAGRAFWGLHRFIIVVMTEIKKDFFKTSNYEPFAQAAYCLKTMPEL